MRGGARAGAGRPPGARSRRTVEHVAAIEASGMAPLDYMVAVMRDKDVDPQVRLETAKGAAPYCHARLSSTELAITDAATLVTASKTPEELEADFLGIVRSLSPAARL